MSGRRRRTGGPIALIRDGDMITLDAVRGEISVELSDAELAARRAAWTGPAPDDLRRRRALEIRPPGRADPARRRHPSRRRRASGMSMPTSRRLARARRPDARARGCDPAALRRGPTRDPRHRRRPLGDHRRPAGLLHRRRAAPRVTADGAFVLISDCALLGAAGAAAAGRGGADRQRLDRRPRRRRRRPRPSRSQTCRTSPPRRRAGRWWAAAASRRGCASSPPRCGRRALRAGRGPRPRSRSPASTRGSGAPSSR